MRQQLATLQRDLKGKEYTYDQNGKVLLLSKKEVIKKDNIVEVLEDASFWRELTAVCGLLQPISKAVMGIQDKHATLADVTK